MLRDQYIFLLVFILSWTQGTAWSQGSWEKLDLPTQQHLRSVYFTDSLYGWICGDSGTFLHTYDGGENWEFQYPGTDNRLVDVFFLDRMMGWAVSWNYDPFFGTVIHKTSDGGEHWSSHAYPEENIFINHILFLDSLTGWMGGSPHALVHSSDGGENWEQAIIDTSTLSFFPVLKIVFYDYQYGYASGGMFDIAGVTWNTSNGGENWQVIKTEDAPADEVHGLHIFDSLTVIGSGGDPDLGYGVGMIRTHNGGGDWQYEELSMPGAAYDLDFRNDTEAWAPLGPNQRLIYSLDAGSSWTRIDSPGNTSIFDMIFPDSLHGYGVGYNGSFIRYIPVPVSIQETEELDIGMSIFPNPSRGQIMIKLDPVNTDIEQAGELEIQINDVYGREIILRSATINSIGGNQFHLDVSAFPAGIYFVNLKLLVDGKIMLLSRKFILR